MTDVFAATDSGILVPTRLRTQVIPWETLKALNPPHDQPQVSTDMLSAFAVLVAQGPRTPALLGTDEHSALLVNAEINQHTTVGRPQNAGDQVVMVSDPTFGGAGDVFVVIPNAGGPAHGPYQVSGAGQDADGTMHMFSALAQNIGVGDGVRRLPLVGFSGLLNGVVVNNPFNNAVAVQEYQISYPPFSSLVTLQGTSRTTAGNTTIVAGVVGKSLYLFGGNLSVVGQTAGGTIALLVDNSSGITIASVEAQTGAGGAQSPITHWGTKLSQQSDLVLQVPVIGTGVTVFCSVGVAGPV